MIEKGSPAVGRASNHPARASTGQSNRLATRPAVCRNGRPNRTFRVRQTWIALSGKVSGWEGLGMATLADRPGAPAHAAIKPDRARPPASWRCVTGRPVGRTRAGGRWRRHAHPPTDRTRRAKPHHRYGQQRLACCTVERLMRQPGMKGVRRGKTIKTTCGQPADQCPLDKVNFKNRRHAFEALQKLPDPVSHNIGNGAVFPSVGSRAKPAP